MTTSRLVGFAVVLAVVGVFVLSLVENNKRQKLYSVTNFEECKAAGYPIMESYPEQCATPDGRSFANDAQSVEDTPATSGGATMTYTTTNSTTSAPAPAQGQVKAPPGTAPTAPTHPVL